MPAKAIEGAAVAALGGVLGALAGGLIGELFDLRTPLAIAGATIGVLNGAVSGYRQIYDWSSSHGPVAVVLDSTWALPMTAGAVLANVYGMVVPNSDYLADVSERQNRHVYRRGFVFRKGFAVTIGNVIGGASDVERDRRRRLITDHEDQRPGWLAVGRCHPGLRQAWRCARRSALGRPGRSGWQGEHR